MLSFIRSLSGVTSRNGWLRGTSDAELSTECVIPHFASPLDEVDGQMTLRFVRHARWVHYRYLSTTAPPTCVVGCRWPTPRTDRCRAW